MARSTELGAGAATMRLRSHRRNIVILSSSVASTDKYGALGPRRPTLRRRIRRGIRVSMLLTVIGLMGLARSTRRQLLLAGGLLTVIGIVLRHDPAGVVLLPGLLFLFSTPLIPAMPEADRQRRLQLERELAAYSTPAERRDLEATLDQYSDGDTSEVRDILAGQAVVSGSNGIPGRGQY
jgi:hypothetical protein